MISAGLVASVYPYRKRSQNTWHAVVIGIVIPTIVASLISVADRMSTTQGLVTLRGPNPSVSEPVTIPGSLLDLMAAF